MMVDSDIRGSRSGPEEQSEGAQDNKQVKLGNAGRYWGKKEDK